MHFFQIVNLCLQRRCFLCLKTKQIKGKGAHLVCYLVVFVDKGGQSWAVTSYVLHLLEIQMRCDVGLNLIFYFNADFRITSNTIQNQARQPCSDILYEGCPVPGQIPHSGAWSPDLQPAAACPGALQPRP
jgi:hypothetical protein